MAKDVFFKNMRAIKTMPVVRYGTNILGFRFDDRATPPKLTNTPLDSYPRLTFEVN